MERRDVLLGMALVAGGWSRPGWAHHGWSGFDQDRPLYVAGRVVDARWRNPHAELVLEVPEGLTLPADLAQRPVPPQTAPVDVAGVLARAVVPARRDARWEIELAPLFRLNQWGLTAAPELGAHVEVVGYGLKGERAEALLRAEFLFLSGKAYGLRSAPA
ncbi:MULTISPECIES: DUF6152 family protein [Caldimonas]|uniref:DUF6152 family protein n=1 Tax=Caldimonas TaxID=196013 RepID=UPI000382AE19|nr:MULTISPECIES: DUF6152 family protein [Caldimonas]GIX25149.1 MAG: hypothetical protein KatS3mg122_2380 [Caldimonas sp.]